ncbi:hypothetical protein [Micromonospora rifamycinica]|uniref:hypothetical protein n=1 Tax=Micromonospora rifamycinica TaxID=291594 RepID=UPI00076C9C3C|nr:hypothetical protein [Micromonospora rifamycinica]KWV29618.1 hypothetical protein AWV63_27595 [Micromonospora rifamycinica]
MPWLLAATVAWAVLLGVLTWWSAREDPPTVREQRTLTQAGPVVDRALGRLVAAVGDDAWVLTVPEVERGCRLTPMADGATLSRGLDVLVAEGGERALLERVADRLPADWRAGVRAGASGPRLRADAGEFVAVQGRVTSGGRVRFTADTGCRPVGDGYPGPSAAPNGSKVPPASSFPPGSPATSASSAPATSSAAASGSAVPAASVESMLDGALRALGRSARSAPEPVSAPCPGGGTARTVAVSAGDAPVALTGLRPLAAGSPVVDLPEVYAYRSGPATVLVDGTGAQVRLSASTGCPA